VVSARAKMGMIGHDEVWQVAVGRSIPFHGKMAAIRWLKGQGYVRSGSSWILGDCSANWVQIPGSEPSGVIVVSQRYGGV